MFSEEAIKLAKDSIEAIKFLAERQKEECPECEGRGWLVGYHAGNCPKCKGIGKVKGKWEWKPKKGQYFIDDSGIVRLIGWVDLSRNYLWYPCQGQIQGCAGKISDCMPLLHWEKIREIMLSLGYKLYFRNPLEGATVAFEKVKEMAYSQDIIEILRIEENIPSNHWHHAPSFQLATMEALIQFRKNK